MEGQNIIMKTEKEATADLLMTKEIPGKVKIMMQDDLHSTAGALGIATAEVLDIARTEANQRPEIRMVSKCEKHHIHFHSEKDTKKENVLMTQDIKILRLKKTILSQIDEDVNHKDKAMITGIVEKSIDTTDTDAKKIYLVIRVSIYIMTEAVIKKKTDNMERQSTVALPEEPTKKRRTATTEKISDGKRTDTYPTDQERKA